MNIPDATNAPDSDDVHAGYTPEGGVLARLREWTDVFGWLRLVHVLRIAGSVTALGTVAITLAIWVLGVQWIGNPKEPDEFARFGTAVQVSGLQSVVGRYAVATPSSLLDRRDFPSSLRRSLLFVVWSTFTWAPAMLYLMRQGALLTAGRSLADAKEAAGLAIRRTPLAWLIATIPLVCGLAVGISVMLLGLISRVSMGVQWIEFFFAVGIAIVSIVGGVLLFGANFSVLLGWTSLINEEQPDALDSLSRGYEYLYRRPLHLAMYLAIALIPLWVVVRLSAGITQSAAHLCQRMLSASGASDNVRDMASQLMFQFPTVVAITLAGGLLGGIYLLIRCDAGGQEVEDVWIASAASRPSLPALPNSASE
tara:strand:+ start:484763 stop:485863 length:1101 start_codon:yes stop_codon:yes gene_type:complete